MDFEELISPIGVERFYDEFKHKKHFIIRSKKNIFEDYFSWDEFDNYLNQIKIGMWDRTPQLQIILPDGRKWCKKKSQEKYDRYEIYDLWNQGCSFILTISEFLNKTMWNQCKAFEKHYGVGQANLYCTKKADGYCFPIHADSTDNFLFHVTGNVKWYMYHEFAEGQTYRPDDATLEEEFVLNDGDLLYIPKKKYHRVDTLGPRISISFHFQEPTKGKPFKRNDWLDWKP